ncbi:E3 ubiquitin-protein ligase TRIM39-like [Salarias fasciatus]|uniref:E3 ubiquitin-protein ligase TRIM39-like n=1 Tax=Salarias fasciatus TaxID=181472 RepID=A0A672HR63_SALFA|nr:E3 ubiquitin-protein ligase TRIM39-like [Salarias fasciatus]
MSVTSCLLAEDQLLCCICLEVFTEPVTIPCGHNFCKSCITRNWNVNSCPCQCPLCKKQFKTRPELPVNTFISEIAAEFKQSAGKGGGGGGGLKTEEVRPGEVPCDICTGRKLKAVKSCLTCLASYCPVHLDPHQTSDRLKTHLLVDPVDNMEGRLCAEHQKPLELFCRHERVCVCSHCSVSTHSGHSIVSLKVEYEERRCELDCMEAALQKRIQKRQQQKQQMTLLKRHSQEDAEREIANGVQIFTALTQTAERGLNELIEKIERRQKRMDQEADGYIGELEGEMTTLRKRSEELQQLAHTQDYLQALQNFPASDAVLNSRMWTAVRVASPLYEGSAERAVAELERMLSREKQQLLHRDGLRRVQHYAVDLVLRPDTAHPWLVLSEDGKQVQSGEVRRDLPDNPERFSLYANVLAQQGFSCGRFYYEVQVSGKSDWTLGVASSSVNRKSIVPISPVNGFWTVSLRNGNQYLALASPVVGLPLASAPRRVGVFVSYEEGLVSFHDVDQAVRLYSFTNCCFSEELYPLFSPGLHHGGRNAAPLVIAPVSRDK